MVGPRVLLGPPPLRATVPLPEADGPLQAEGGRATLRGEDLLVLDLGGQHCAQAGRDTVESPEQARRGNREQIRGCHPWLFFCDHQETLCLGDWGRIRMTFGGPRTLRPTLAIVCPAACRALDTQK